jgi:hypothetical protein
MTRSVEYQNRHIFTSSAEKTVYDEFYRICRRDGKPLNSMIQNFMEDYIKAHGEGNSTFKLDTWTEDPNFKAVPTILANNEQWHNYIDDCTKTEKLKLLKSVNDVRDYLGARL